MDGFSSRLNPNEPGRTGDWLGVPMFFSHFDPETTADLLADAGFRVTKVDVESQLEGDREIDFVWFSARR